MISVFWGMKLNIKIILNALDAQRIQVLEWLDYTTDLHKSQYITRFPVSNSRLFLSGRDKE